MNKNKITLAGMLVCGLLLSGTVLARDNNFTRIYEQYKDKADMTALSLSGSMLHSFFKGSDRDVNDLLSKIKEVKIMAYDGNAGQVGEMTETFSKCLSTSAYKDLMTVNDGGDKVTFKSVNDNNKMTGLVMLVTDSNSVVVIYVDGDISMDNARQLASHFTARGRKM